MEESKNVKQKPLVSIIMGIYNCQNILPQAIKSILSQTYERWELIMCDDGSTDNTYQVALKYAEKYENISVLQNKKNMRLAYSLNKCLKVAKGKYIARMDADDISLKERIEKQVDFLEKNPKYAVVGSSALIYGNGKENEIRYPGEYPDKYTLLTHIPYMHPTIMMRKEIYEVLGGYTVSKETIRGQDLEMWFRFYEKGYCGYNIKEPLLKYHESFNDYKKMNIKRAWGIFKINLKGFEKLGFPKWKYFHAFRPLICAFIPNRFRCFYHNIKQIFKRNIVLKKIRN